MKIIVPDFVLPTLAAQSCSDFNICDFVTLSRTCEMNGSPEGTEIILLPFGTPPELQHQLLSLPTLRWVQTVSAGVDQSIVAELQSRDVILTNAGGVFDRPIAETVLAYILMILKRLPEYAGFQREHRWKRLPQRETTGLTVGIIGTGNIGQEIARLCKGLEMHVIGTRRHPERPVPYIDELFSPEQLPELLAISDFVVLATPLTPETRRLIGPAQLRQMKSDAWLINIARGAIVDEPALITALQEKQIAGAALDVFTEEPLPADSPLWDLPNVILTPHQSWSTPYLEKREAELFLENLRRYLNGEPLQNQIDKTLGY